MEEKKKILKKLAEVYFIFEETNKDLNDFWLNEMKDIYNLLARYIFLGGKLPSKYGLDIHLFANPKDKKFLNNPKLYEYLPVSTTGIVFQSLIRDIGKGKVKLKANKHFKKSEIDKIYRLTKEFIQLNIHKLVSEKRYEVLLTQISNSRDKTERTKAIYKTILEVI